MGGAQRDQPESGPATDFQHGWRNARIVPPAKPEVTDVRESALRDYHLGLLRRNPLAPRLTAEETDPGEGFPVGRTVGAGLSVRDRGRVGGNEALR